MTSDATARPILIVEDDEPTQSLLQAVLRRCGHTSEIAANGLEAITLLETNHYTAIILDLMMPEVSGRDVVDFLASAANPTPVIICSAAGPAALAQFDSTIVKAIVRKPFDVDELIAAITGVAGGRV